MATEDMYWRIATSQAGLLNQSMVALGFGVPDQFQYKPYSVKNSQGDGGTARHGFHTADVLWTKLTPNQAHTLRNILDTVGTSLLYMTARLLDGSDTVWADISGKIDPPDIAPDLPIRGSDGFMHSNIRVRLNNVTILDTTPTF